ncbi:MULTISPECIES: hypothetical protein [unclassified Saccharibacter]|uniref:hypothetical protein n=1 Tax=unclassified Saccharibacter TaxID=2648722 RepID=UPI001322FAF7|nr:MULTISPECIES: hypothetical protein [unclassified Saccharibacter]MXV36430.1 hypothetical protein [Saccharibacter sp. EH611]MXV57592.1 hypothetical protein [Saccharibacter sp. EH70]MXV65101.1 hypothetical protein [Saccharibacter sp. EH60]
MVRKLTYLALTMLALLSLQIGPVTMTHASTSSNMVSSMHSMHHSMDQAHGGSDLPTMMQAAAGQHHAMIGKCCVTHSGVCDLVLLSDHKALFALRDGKRARLYEAFHHQPTAYVPALLRPPISFLA